MPYLGEPFSFVFSSSLACVFKNALPLAINLCELHTVFVRACVCLPRNDFNLKQNCFHYTEFASLLTRHAGTPNFAGTNFKNGLRQIFLGHGDLNFHRTHTCLSISFTRLALVSFMQTRFEGFHSGRQALL